MTWAWNPKITPTPREVDVQFTGKATKDDVEEQKCMYGFDGDGVCGRPAKYMFIWKKQRVHGTQSRSLACEEHGQLAIVDHPDLVESYEEL